MTLLSAAYAVIIELIIAAVVVFIFFVKRPHDFSPFDLLRWLHYNSILLQIHEPEVYFV